MFRSHKPFPIFLQKKDQVFPMTFYILVALYPVHEVLNTDNRALFLTIQIDNRIDNFPFDIRGG